MATNLIERKHNKAFGHLDVNHNGYVEHQDLIDFCSRLMAGFNVEPATPKGRNVLNGFERFWQALLSAVDLDGDRRLSPEEWRAGMTGAFVEPGGGFERDFRPAVQAALDLADTDGDGVVNPEEFATMQRACHTSEDDIRQAFAHLDTDGSGTLTVDELVTAARQFYTGTDDQAVGNWLFGRV